MAERRGGIVRAPAGTGSCTPTGGQHPSRESRHEPELMRQTVRPPSAALRRVIAAATVVMLPLIAASCSMPAIQSSEISQGELMLQLSDALAGMRSDGADLQAQIDSLRTVVARQDSLLVRLASATGVPLR